MAADVRVRRSRLPAQDITLHQGEAIRTETVDGGGDPVHKPATAGWSGYGDLQRTTEEAVRMNVRALAAVCAALREGDVETSIVGDLTDGTVCTGTDRLAIAPNADVLSELGEAPYRVVPAVEALPFVAITKGASVVRVDDRPTPAGGVAALLRYAPTNAIDSDGASRQSVSQ